MGFFKERRGFASMSAEKQREISSKGGKAAHAKGAAHQFTPLEAKEAGRLGGAAIAAKPGHMAKIGAKGGQIRGEQAARKRMAQAADAASSQFVGTRETDSLNLDKLNRS